jgi:predicted nucleic acid-binding protein
VAIEFIAAFRKVAGRGQKLEEAWQYLQEFLELLPLILPNRAVIDRARTLHVEEQWSFRDALIAAACIEAGVTRFYSEDLPGKRPPEPLEIIRPFA